MSGPVAPSFRAEVWPVSKLVPNERNARTHSDAQVAQVAASIREFGFTVPILIEPSGRIVAGHGRWRAARLLGLEEVDVRIIAGWSEEQVRAYLIADNKLALNAGWDDALLAAELAEIGAAFDPALLGFTDAELAVLWKPAQVAGLTDPDEAPPVATDPVSRIDDVWVLGSHRLVCGDARSKASLRAGLGDRFADAVWTDPPYNVAYEGAAGSIQNDSMPAGAFDRLLQTAFLSIAAVMKQGAPIYVAYGDLEALAFLRAFRFAGLKQQGSIIWAKDSLVLGRKDYQQQHEPILYGWREGARHRWYGGRRNVTLQELPGGAFHVLEDGSVMVRIGDESLVIRGENLSATAVEPTILHYPKPRRSSEHPTMKPVELIARCLRNSTEAGDLVLDPFAGSGSTLIACEQMGRVAVVVELEPRFVDVIVRRWEAFTGQVARRASDGVAFSAAWTAREVAAALK